MTSDGYRYIDDDHRAVIHADSWAILEHVLPRATQLRAVCYECEHNAAEETVETFQRLNALFPAHVA